MMQDYWEKYPDLYQIVQLKNQIAAMKKAPQEASKNNIPGQKTTAITVKSKTGRLLTQPLRGSPLRARVRESHHGIRQRVLALNADIIPRTQPHNRKCAHQSLEEARDFRADIVEGQIQSWRSMLPMLIRKFSKIPDHRRPGSIKHKITVLMVFGLFSFIFRLSSRREINRELTSPVIFEHLKRLFPELDSIPHADTLARLLENTNPKAIERIHISLIKDLIVKKKFKQLLIHDCLPITIDGTQKLYRDGLLQVGPWCERTVGDPAKENKQQYIYAVEANITLKNGLTIPLMTEYMYRENNQIMQPKGKQDSETTAFERLAVRLKKYFPRLKMVFFRLS